MPTWITAALAAALLIASPGGCGGSSDTTHPRGQQGCDFHLSQVTAVQVASENPKVRISMHVTCGAQVVTTLLTYFKLEHKESRLTGTWLEVGTEAFNHPPGLKETYTMLHTPCVSGRYRVKVSMDGTFTNGERFQASEDNGTSGTFVDCDNPERIRLGS
ncbi:hypothetical protein OIE66_30665 [Nonomuraea sp. NBC_01738]|uniref:hypothetical protein n=1 Tax=Nonomuraea sp. NBC_01738 TaxID=2976003 RepID=UPI002E13D721|nr:hypothetical protein OIE66_30665 [Nonomuraea sp. NBC_01738]